MRFIRLLGLAACLAFLFSPTWRPVWADEETEEAEETEEVEEQKTIEFTDGFAAGQKIAKEKGKLLFVYVGRHSPT